MLGGPVVVRPPFFDLLPKRAREDPVAPATIQVGPGRARFTQFSTFHSKLFIRKFSKRHFKAVLIRASLSVHLF
jgi:hypothetical protein